MATQADSVIDIDPKDPFAWMKLSACRGLDNDRFHSEHPKDIVWSKSICSDCPVVSQCLEYQLPFDRQYGFGRGLGVYGGMTREERRAFWRRLQRAKQPYYVNRWPNV